MGGAEKLMVDLLPRMKECGHDVDLCVFDGTRTPFYDEIEARGVRVVALGTSVYNPLFVLKLVKLMRHYDIVHSHNTACQFYVAMAGLFTSCQIFTTEHNTTNRRRDWKCFILVDYWMYSRYKSIICISDKTREQLLTYLPCLHSVSLVYNGVPLEDYSSAQPNESLFKDYRNCVKIMMIAGFRCQKDQPTVIRSLLDLPEKFHLFLVGDGLERNICETLTANLNLTTRVHFLGVRSDVPSLIKASDVCVISSHWEGFGLAAVEGMAAGKPIVASDIPGVAEIVRGAGILFDKGNPSDLAIKILSLMENEELYKKISQACQNRSLEYSIDKMVDGYMNVYNKIAK